MRSRVSILLPVVLLATAGCGNLDVNPSGALQTPLVEPACSTKEHPVVLAFNRLGRLTLNGAVLDLPSAREDRRFGIVVVDVGALPPLWRPDHAREGGVLVARIQKASPLAFNGLRPFDLVKTVDGQPVEGVIDLIQRLQVPHDQPLELQAIKPDGSEITISALADDRVGEANKNHVPLLFESHITSTGYAFALGPLDTLFYFRVHNRHQYVASKKLAHSGYRECAEWGVLGNLLLYQRERDPETGQEKSRLRLFWLLSLGDDL